MQKVIIVKAKTMISKEDCEKIECKIKEKTGINAIVFDNRFNVEVVGCDE